MKETKKNRLAKEQGSMLTVTAILVLDFQAHAGEGDMGTVNGLGRVCWHGRLWAACGDKG